MDGILPNLTSILMVSVPCILLGGIFLIGAVDGFTFILTGSLLIHPPTYF